MAVKYFDYRGRSNCRMQIYISGRGVGKTFSVFDEMVKTAERTDSESKWLYVRMTETEVDSVCGDNNGFRDYNIKTGTDVRFESGKNISTIVQYIPFKCENCDRRVIGYAKSLASFHNLRGVSFADVDYIFFDEFIPEPHVVKTKVQRYAGQILANMYESINRNRELEGREPVKLILAANLNGLDSNILLYFGLLPVISKMRETGQSRYTDRERDIYLELVSRENDVSIRKKDTWLYKAVRDKDYTNMALNNDFSDDVYRCVQKVNLTEYNPYIQYGGISIMKHKSKPDVYHVRVADSSARIRYDFHERDKLYRDFYTDYICAVLDKHVTYEDIAVKELIDSALNRRRIK